MTIRAEAALAQCLGRIRVFGLESLLLPFSRPQARRFFGDIMVPLSKHRGRQFRGIHIAQLRENESPDIGFEMRGGLAMLLCPVEIVPHAVSDRIGSTLPGREIPGCHLFEPSPSALLRLVEG